MRQSNRAACILGRWMGIVLLLVTATSAGAAELINATCRKELKTLCPAQQRWTQQNFKKCYDEKRAQLSPDCVTHLDKVMNPKKFANEQKAQKVNEVKTKAAEKKAAFKGKMDAKHQELKEKASSLLGH